MSPVAIATIVACVFALIALVRAMLVFLKIGSDVHGVGPWNRPRRTPPRTRLPADLRSLWALFGLRSLARYPGSWEAASKRLERIEETIVGRPIPETRIPEQPSGAWLNDRVGRLETMLDIEGHVVSSSDPIDADRSKPPRRAGADREADGITVYLTDPT